MKKSCAAVERGSKDIMERYAKDLERIFERFYRVDPGRARQTGGTGLGLSIVRHVAQNHGGAVSVNSREGEGSTFMLDLPLSAL